MADFAYQPFVNPYAASMADEIARSGDAHAHAAEMIGLAQARAAQIKSQAYAGAVQNIASIPAQIEQQRSAQIDQQLKRQQLQEGIDSKQEQTRQRIVMTIGRLANGAKSPEDFVSGLGDMAGLGGLPKDVAAHVAAQVQAAGPDGWDAVKTKYVEFGSQYEQAVKMGANDRLVKPSTGKVIVDAVPKPVDLGPGHSLVQPPAAPGAQATTVATAPFAPGTGQHVVNGQVVDAEGAPVGAAVPKQVDPVDEARQKETARHNAEMEKIANLTAGRETARDAEIRRHNLATESQNEAAPTLTPEAVKLTARQFAMTGNLPPMGMGKTGAAMRATIINAAADEYKGLDLASQKAAYEANKKSLDGLQKQRDAISAFEQTASKNIDIFLDTAGKVVDTGSPLANGLLRQASGKLLGSPDQAAYDAARQVAVNEIAKITSNPNLSGTLSDSARHEIEAFNPQSATLAQSVKVMRLLKQDMANRASSMDDQIKAVQQRIATPPGQSSGGGAVTVTDPQGGTHTFPSQAAADAFKAKAGIK